MTQEQLKPYGGVTDILEKADFLRRKVHYNKSKGVNHLAPCLEVLSKESVGGDINTLGILLFNCRRGEDKADECLLLTHEDFDSLFEQQTETYLVRHPDAVKGASGMQLRGLSTPPVSMLKKPPKTVKVRSCSKLSPLLKQTLELEHKAVKKITSLLAKEHHVKLSCKNNETSDSFSEGEEGEEEEEDEEEEDEEDQWDKTSPRCKEKIATSKGEYIRQMRNVIGDVVIPSPSQVEHVATKCDVVQRAMEVAALLDQENSGYTPAALLSPLRSPPLPPPAPSSSPQAPPKDIYEPLVSPISPPAIPPQKTDKSKSKVNPVTPTENQASDTWAIQKPVAAPTKPLRNKPTEEQRKRKREQNRLSREKKKRKLAAAAATADELTNTDSSVELTNTDSSVNSTKQTPA